MRDFWTIYWDKETMHGPSMVPVPDDRMITITLLCDMGWHDDCPEGNEETVCICGCHERKGTDSEW